MGDLEPTLDHRVSNIVFSNRAIKKLKKHKQTDQNMLVLSITRCMMANNMYVVCANYKNCEIFSIYQKKKK